MQALRPEPLERARLSDALTGVAERWSALHGIAVQVTTTGTARPVSPDVEFALLRAAQEALANVGKHARATRVGLTLSYMDHEVALDVRDDGQGFDPGRLPDELFRNGTAPASLTAGMTEGSAAGPGDTRGGPGHGAGGFGLAAMRQRIEGLSGTLQVESEPGGGTAISARLPACPAGRRGAAGARAGPGMTSPGQAALGVGAPVRLLIVDDHPVVRDGLTGMFAADPGFEVLGEAADGAEAVRLAQALGPDVILMDLRMPGMDGVAAITELARRGIPARVLVLTTYDTDSHVLPAIEAGATGYLLKDAPRAELLRAVRSAAQGQAVLSPSVATRLMSRVRTPGAEPLSQRELEVLELVAAGTTNREAAARLFISEATVKTHLLHIYAKLGVSDRAAAVAEAFNRGLLTPAGPDH